MMKIVWWTLRGLLAAFLALLLFSSALRGEWLSLILLALALVAIVQPTGRLRRAGFSWLVHPVTRIALVLAALLAFAGIVRVSAPRSIYASEEVRSRFYRMYDEKMSEWPVPFEDRYIETGYGRIHVVVSGQEDLPPLLLLHASGISSWSWKYNVEGLIGAYRVYAIDLIGDAGKSEYRNLDHVLRSKEDQAPRSLTPWVSRERMWRARRRVGLSPRTSLSTMRSAWRSLHS
jgi:hypothetical protein